MIFSNSFHNSLKFFAALLLLQIAFSCSMQKHRRAKASANLWTPIAADSLYQSKDSLPKKFCAYQLNEPMLLDSINKVSEGYSILLKLPTPDCTFVTYRLEEMQTMAPALAAKYPFIKTYAGESVLNHFAKVRLEIINSKLSAYFYSNDSQYYISSIGPSDKHCYIVYFKVDSAQPKIQFEESEKN